MSGAGDDIRILRYEYGLSALPVHDRDGTNPRVENLAGHVRGRDMGKRRAEGYPTVGVIYEGE